MNGSFELPSIPEGQITYLPAAMMLPWQTTDTRFEVWANGVADGNSIDGMQNLEVLADATPSTVWQDIPTSAGEDYTFSFYHTPRPNFRSTLTVLIDSRAIATFDENGENLTKYNWAMFQTNFTAAASTTRISFVDTSLAGAAGAHIDDVMVKHLPLTLGLRISEVEIRWATVANRTYQIQYRSTLTSNQWVDLGSPLLGNGGTTSIADRVPTDEPRRFYRVVELP